MSATAPEPAALSAHHLAAIRAVGGALLRRNDEVTAAMLAAITAEVPIYRRARPGVLDDVRTLATATAQALSEAMSSGAPVRRDDVPILREHAARRAAQGIELEPFLHAYRAALFRYWDACAAEAARIEISRDAGLALARFALDCIDTITTHAAEAYLREDTRLRTQSGRDARDLIERLIAGQPLPDDSRHPAAPGLDPTHRLAVIVARVQAADRHARDSLVLARDGLEDSLAMGKARPLVAVRHGEVVLITAGATGSQTVARLHMARRRALQDHGLEVHYGASTAPNGFSGVARAYREAALTLSYSTAARPVVSLPDLSCLQSALLGANTTTRQIIDLKGRALTALADSERALTATTVTAFADADMNIARTAATLSVHPNTVRHRLARTAESTGYDPRTFAGLVELVCIIELAAAAPPPPA